MQVPQSATFRLPYVRPLLVGAGQNSTSASGPPVSDDRWCRVLNVAVAATAVLVASPIMLLIAMLVWLSSPGPVIFRQVRIGIDRRRGHGALSAAPLGRGGRPFTMYKFRTMHVSRDDEQVWAKAGDSRITLVGRWLRATRLDELPQFVNVLRGDMNVVGPRPEQPVIFSRLAGQIRDYARRQLVRPGITGLAQISQAYDETLDDVRRKVRYDLAYIQRRSLREDLRILARTLPVMLGARGR